AVFLFSQAEDGIQHATVTGVQTCALPTSAAQAGAPLRMEHVGSRADANTGNCPRSPEPQKPPRHLQRAAFSCIPLRTTRDGKEGVDGLSPSEGSAKAL